MIESVLERMERIDAKKKIADFMVKEKMPYDFKIRYATVRANGVCEGMRKAGSEIPCQRWRGGSLLLYKNNLYTAKCKKCGMNSTVCIGNETAIRNWNTRAPILSAEEMEMLEGME